MLITADAWILGSSLVTHDRLWDHHGTEPDSVVTLAADIGRYPAGTDVHTVLADLVARLTFVEQNRYAAVFTLTAAATLSAAHTTSLTADALITSPIYGLTADAVFFKVYSLRVDAYLIDNPCP
jgi:hypothetical protein